MSADVAKPRLTFYVYAVVDKRTPDTLACVKLTRSGAREWINAEKNVERSGFLRVRRARLQTYES